MLNIPPLPAMDSTVATLTTNDTPGGTTHGEDASGRRDWTQLRFRDANLESAYIAKVFTDAAVVCFATSLVLGIVDFSILGMDFQAALASVPPWEIISLRGDFLVKPWALGWYLAVAITLTTIGSLGLLLTLGFKVPIPARLIDVLFVLVAWLWALAGVATLSFRRPEWCTRGKFSLIMRHRDFVSRPCPDFADAYHVGELAPFFALWGRPSLTLIAVAFLLPFFALDRLLHFSGFWTSDLVHIFSCVIVFVLTLQRDRIRRRQFLVEVQLRRDTDVVVEGQRAIQRLLHAVLPPKTMVQVLQEKTVADRAVCPILFSDIAGFTAWCSRQTTNDVIAMLNDMYLRFDAGLKRYGVEKVKTIGDAYWVVCGVPVFRPDHALRVCVFSQFMLRELAAFRDADARYAALSIRIGVHTGVLVGGINPTQRRLTYEVFGHANEVAEYMEQCAPTGGVLLSQPAKVALVGDLEALWDNDDSGGTTVESIFGERVSLAGMTAGEHEPTHAFTLSPLPAWCARVVARTGAEVAEEEAEWKGDRGHGNGDDLRTADILQGSDSSSSAGGATVEMVSEAERVSKRAHRFRLTFADEAIEDAYVARAQASFAEDAVVVHVVIAVLCALFLVVMGAEGVGHSPAAWTLVAATLLLHLVWLLARGNMAPRLLFGSFYVSYLLLIAGFALDSPALLSYDLLWLPFLYSFLMPSQGSCGISWVYLNLLNVVVIVVPIVVVQIYFAELYVHHLIGPGFFIAVWLIGLRDNEVSQRQRFVDSVLAEEVLRASRANEKKVTSLLSRTLPAFTVDRVVRWFCSGKQGYIADQLPNCGVLFLRVNFQPKQGESPAGRDDHATDEVDPMKVMARGGNVLRLCDDVGQREAQRCAGVEHCTFVKSIGDVLLFVSGLARAREPDPIASSSLPGSPATGGCYGKSDDSPAEHLVSLSRFATAVAERADECFGDSSASVTVAGLHCGPVSGGVIGDDRLMYDVFGDTVNTASRVMSTSGSAGVWMSSAMRTTLVGPDHETGAHTTDDVHLPQYGLILQALVPREMKGKGTVYICRVRPLAP